MAEGRFVRGSGTVSGDAERGVVMEDEFLVIACASAIWGIDEDLDRRVLRVNSSASPSWARSRPRVIRRAAILADAGSRIFGLRLAVFESSVFRGDLSSCTSTS